jgi:hypothetical protein
MNTPALFAQTLVHLWSKLCPIICTARLARMVYPQLITPVTLAVKEPGALILPRRLGCRWLRQLYLKARAQVLYGLPSCLVGQSSPSS